MTVLFPANAMISIETANFCRLVFYAHLCKGPRCLCIVSDDTSGMCPCARKIAT